MTDATKPKADLSKKQRYANHYEEQIGFLVERFADALSSKLRKAEEKYQYQGAWRRAGWASECRSQLLRHADKGDPLDVAAYCAFAWHHGWSIAPDPIEPEAEDREVAEKLALKHHANSKSTLADDVAAALATVRAQMQARVDAMQESVHYANGVADLAMKHRDMAEAALERARATIMFFVSVIKSGEPWTQTCEDAKRAALETPPCK